MKHHKRIEELEKAIYNAKQQLMYAESNLLEELERANPLPYGWRRLSVTTPFDTYLLVCTDFVALSGFAYSIAKQTKAACEDRYYWRSIGGDEYCGVKYWQYLPEIPCEE